MKTTIKVIQATYLGLCQFGITISASWYFSNVALDSKLVP
jgi:hypothetical protein